MPEASLSPRTVVSAQNRGIIRIGRNPTPSERGLQNALERPALLDYLSRNFCRSELGLSARAAVDTWEAMGENERDEWRERTIEHLRTFVAHRGLDGLAPDDPDPGSTLNGEDLDMVEVA